MNEYLFAWLEQSTSFLNIFSVAWPALSQTWSIKESSTGPPQIHFDFPDTDKHIPQDWPVMPRAVCWLLFNNLCWRRMVPEWRGLSSTRTRTLLPSPAPLQYNCSKLLPACNLILQPNKLNSKSNSKIWRWYSKNLNAGTQGTEGRGWYEYTGKETGWLETQAQQEGNQEGAGQDEAHNRPILTWALLR